MILITSDVFRTRTLLEKLINNSKLDLFAKIVHESFSVFTSSVILDV